MQKDGHTERRRDAWRRLLPTKKNAKQEAMRSQSLNSNKLKKKLSLWQAVEAHRRFHIFYTIGS
jgi:hypothetical protein